MMRVEAIRALGAKIVIVKGNYDDAVQVAEHQSRKYGWLLVQDMAWEGYEEIPKRIMQGYLTLISEIIEQLDGDCPTHVFVQRGVGSLAGALLAYFYESYGNDRPLFVVVEPNDAACYFESMAMYHGKPTKIRSKLNTIMAGLACGEPSRLGWRILGNLADAFIACSDKVAASGMRILARSLQGDKGIISGESGAVTLGLLHSLLSSPTNKNIADKLKLNEKSKVLLISTEGDTDPIIYRKIVSGHGSHLPQGL